MTPAHHAGPLVNQVQRCTRCGLILSDYRNAGWPEGHEPTGWTPGHFVTIDGNFTSSSPTANLLCGERPN